VCEPDLNSISAHHYWSGEPINGAFHLGYCSAFVFREQIQTAASREKTANYGARSVPSITGFTALCEPIEDPF